MGRLVSLNVGLPRDVAWRGQTVHTGIWKRPVEGRRMVRRLNVDGDGQGDLAGHGGEHRAVMVYQTESYSYWEAHFNRSDFTPGQFGENFTVDGLPDDEVCIGDRFRIGAALFEVTQPRVTCYRVGIRMNVPEMAALLVAHHRPGFYFRVIEEGEVGAGDEIEKVWQDPEGVTVAEIDALLYLPGHPRERLRRTLNIPALSTGWKTSLRALVDTESKGTTVSGNPGLSPDSGAPPAWPGFRRLRVASVTRESASVVSLSFEPTDQSPLPVALPGQFLVLKVPVKAGGPALLRNYSMSGAPGGQAYRISVKREAEGLASSFLCQFVKAGDSLEVSAPRGSFTLREGSGPVVLMSAGIGATPVLAMLHALADSSSTREVWWLYGARNRMDHPFAQESRALVARLAQGRIHVMYSRPDAADQPGRDYDSPGRLNASLLDEVGVSGDADFYLCGPQSFLDEMTAGLRNRGTSSNQIHSEIFGPGASITPGITPSNRPQPHAPPGEPGRGPEISFTRSGIVAPWGNSYSSILELAEACDVPVKWSCRTGVCHTCESALIGGAVEYDPEPLEPPADGSLLICCARPKGEIQIDL